MRGAQGAVIFADLRIMLASIAILFALSAPVSDNPVKWKFSATAAGDGIVRVELRSEVQPGWHIYATSLPSDQGPVATSIRFQESESFNLVGPLHEPKALEVFDPNFSMEVRYHEGSPVFTQLIKPNGAGEFDVVGEVEFMVCNDKTCLPPVKVPFKLHVESI